MQDIWLIFKMSCITLLTQSSPCIFFIFCVGFLELSINCLHCKYLSDVACEGARYYLNLVLLVNINEYHLYNLRLWYVRLVLLYFTYLNELYLIVVTYYETIILLFHEQTIHITISSSLYKCKFIYLPISIFPILIIIGA